MPLYLNDDQTMLRDTARAFVSEQMPVAHMRRLRDTDDATGFDPALWKQFAEMGFTGILIGEDAGGLGLGHVEAGVVLEEIGRNLSPSPFLSTAVAAVEALVAPRAGSPAFVLTDAWGARDIAGVLRASERMLERTGDPRSHTIPRVVGALANHVSRLRAVQRLEAQGVVSKDAATQLKLHPFYVRKLYTQARNYSVDELRGATVRLAELDHALKGGSRLSNELELERALVEITARS